MWLPGSNPLLPGCHGQGRIPRLIVGGSAGECPEERLGDGGLVTVSMEDGTAVVREGVVSDWEPRGPGAGIVPILGNMAYTAGSGSMADRKLHSKGKPWQ